MKTLFLIIFLLALSAPAAELTVWNLTDGVVTVAATNNFPVGVSRGASSTNLSILFSVPDGSDAVVTLSGSHEAPAVNVEIKEPVNVIYWLGAGMGAAFVWFGFGWIYRMQRKVTDF